MKGSRRSASRSQKILPLSSLIKIVARARREGKRIVTTNGCFDMLHVGHVRSLVLAKKLGDMLIVGINSDRSARRNKPRGRPIIPAAQRAEMLAAMSSVDYVYIFGDLTPDAWLKKLRPHFHAKGSDRTLSQIVERETVQACGGTIVLLPHTGKHSTTKIIEKILLSAPTARHGTIPKKGSVGSAR